MMMMMMLLLLLRDLVGILALVVSGSDESLLICMHNEKFEDSAGCSLDRKTSLDSRASEGEYEIGGFVVEDEYLSEGEGGSVGSEITVYEDEDDDVQEEEFEGRSETESETESVSLTFDSSISTSTPCSRNPTKRKRSTTSTSTSTSSSSTALFIPDPNNPPTPLSSPPQSTAPSPTHIPPTPFGILSNTPLSTSSSTETAEEITDAVVFFSRRCNKHRAALLLRLGEDVVVGEVGEALEGARRAGVLLGVWTLWDGTVGVYVGGGGGVVIDGW
ncbi:hypothetical protein T440DRAFT_475472 [Plenodomus tracheiphilus IPT5]|uniref:Uncharacterized protein n=1 Tax=Plenodomus tracheiphilus IPT5 TaxID=1408161 RepID=A0A6A7BIR8_9PLEO|nr:hypothetical protein T440DRAFT_475472 [Plenodomus tracheiphilus IPT5]